jgi:hypothetical protein
MENIITIFPYAGQLTSPSRQPKIASRFSRSRAFQHGSEVREGTRSNYVVGINRQTERFYGFANLVAVVIMAAALVSAFATCLTSIVG